MKSKQIICKSKINTEWKLPFVVPGRAWWWPRLPKNRVAVCMLHSVGNDLSLPDCPANNVIESEKLRAVIRLLKDAGYLFTTFGAAFGEETPLSTGVRRVCLTFDDGYVDNYTTLFPILKEEGVPATLFVTNRGETDAHFLSAVQIQELDKSGLVEIGGHTASHCFMLHTDKESAKREIDTNKMWLEGLLEHSITSFAYPRGEYDAEVVRFVQEAGYKCAATMEKHQRQPPTDAFHIHRQILPRGKSPYELYLLATRGKYRL